ncbi:MAG: transcriptional regulator [archaeon]
MKPPCMIMASAILPAIRVSIAQKLAHSGTRPGRIATLMGITPAAVTQYLSGARGREWTGRLTSIDIIAKELDDLAEGLMNPDVDQTSTIQKICNICRIVRSEGLLCDAHASTLPGLNTSNCGICRAP